MRLEGHGRPEDPSKWQWSLASPREALLALMLPVLLSSLVHARLHPACLAVGPAAALLQPTTFARMPLNPLFLPSLTSELCFGGSSSVRSSSHLCHEVICLTFQTTSSTFLCWSDEWSFRYHHGVSALTSRRLGQNTPRVLLVDFHTLDILSLPPRTRDFCFPLLRTFTTFTTEARNIFVVSLFGYSL